MTIISWGIVAGIVGAIGILFGWVLGEESGLSTESRRRADRMFTDNCKSCGHSHNHHMRWNSVAGGFQERTCLHIEMVVDEVTLIRQPVVSCICQCPGFIGGGPK